MASRWQSSFNEAYADRPAIALVTLADLDFASGLLTVSDFSGNMVWNGVTYSGLGDYGGFDGISEMPDSTARGTVLTLSGVPVSLVSTAMNEQYQGRRVTLYVGLLRINEMDWIDAPEIVWEGRMDFMTIDIQEGSAKIALNCEHRLNKEPVVARYTDQDQQLAFNGDNFFDLTWQIPLATASWGAVTAQHPRNLAPESGASVVRNSGYAPWKP